MFTVVEFAGTDRERVVYETSSFLDAVGYIEDHYTPEEEVDILRDGSTEY